MSLRIDPALERPPVDKLRMKYLRFHAPLLAAFLLGKVRVEGLPEDVEVVDVSDQTFACSNEILIRLRSASFPVVPEGNHMQELTGLVTRADPPADAPLARFA